MTINERFRIIINTLYSNNKRAFARAIDLSPTVIENIVGSRGGNPSYEVIQKVVSNANINADWLITGKGEMLKDNNQPISLVQEQKPIYVTRKQTGNDDIVDKLLNRLEQQSEEIGKLKTELEIYKRGDIPGAMDAGVAVAN